VNLLARPLVLATVIAAGVALLNTPSKAQDAKAVFAKQKEAVVANLKIADLPKATVTETDNFFVVGAVAQEKGKVLGALLEKVVPVARKGLQYDSKEEVWKGKLAVYYLPESRDFKSFIRSAIMIRPEGVYYDVRSETPLVVDPVEISGKATEADQFANTATIVAGAYLKARGTTANIPEWLRIGFGRATAFRAEGLTSKRYQSYKSQAKTAVGGGKTGTAAAISDLWAETKPVNADLLAASLVEYMAYGPGSANFIKLVYGFRPDENGNSPSVEQALEAAGWKDIPMLETNWRKWVATAKQ
jgi:hypothetical protein